MKSLLLKDIYNIKHNMKQMILVLLFISICMFLNASVSGVVVFCSVLCTMMTVTTFAMDEHCSFAKYAMIMPISRKSYVLEKYMACLIFTLTGTTVGFVESVVYGLFTHNLDLTLIFICTGVGILFGLLCGIFYIPILFRFGSEQARLIIFGVFAFLGLIGFLIYWTLNALSIPITIHLLTVSLYLAPMLIILFAVVSYILSLKFFQAKEF